MGNPREKSDRNISVAVDAAGEGVLQTSPKLSRSVLIGLALTTLAVLLFKVYLFQYFKASALFADDYNSLHRARLFLDGLLVSSGENYDLTIEQFPFKIVVAGLLYYIVIAPWVLFEFPERLWFVFALNSVFAGVYMYFGSLAVYRVTQTRSLLVPLVLGTLAAPFIFSFYVMSENLVFPFLGILCWLVSDFEETLRKPGRLLLLIASAAMLPIVRTPGVAVLPALLLVFAMHYKELGLKRMLLFSALLIAAVVLTYVGYTQLASTAREAKYARNMMELLPQAQSWLILGRLSLSQLAYLFVSTGFFALLFHLWMPLTSAGRRALENRGLRDLSIFSLTASAFFIAFCLAHTLMKMDQTGGNGWFIFGRYDDPAAVLLIISGIALAFHFREDNVVQKLIFAALTMVLLATALFYLKDTRWVPISFTGLSFFAAGPKRLDPNMLIAWTMIAGGLLLLPSVWRYRPHLMLVALLAFNYFTLENGLTYTYKRAKGIDFSLEGAYWIRDNTKVDETICMDWGVSREKARGAVKGMGNVFRALMFRGYPRPFLPYRTAEQLSSCDYIYSLKHRKENLSLKTVWENEAYVLFSTKP